MKKQEPVAKIVSYQRKGEDHLQGFRFYSASTEVLLEVGECKWPSTEFDL
jgi:hypothetical protein